MQNNWLKERGIAHRGIIDSKNKIIENTIEACENAIKLDMPIEIDIRITKEDELILLHDPYVTLSNNKTYTFKELTKKDIKQYKIINSNCKIPTLKEILDIVDGKVPLLIEAKVNKDYRNHKKLIRNIALLLNDYKGEYAIQSFHTNVYNIVKKVNNKAKIGLILPTTNKKTNYILNLINKIILKTKNYDFLSFGIKYIDDNMLNYLKTIKKPILLWTLKNENKNKYVDALNANIIINKDLNYLPKQN